MTLLCEILSVPPLKGMTVKRGPLSGFQMSLGLNEGTLAPRHLKVDGLQGRREHCLSWGLTETQLAHSWEIPR